MNSTRQTLSLTENSLQPFCMQVNITGNLDATVT